MESSLHSKISQHLNGMVDFPAFCDSCGRAVPSGFNFGPGVRNVVIRNSLSSCPHCGRKIHVDGGVDSQGNLYFLRRAYDILSRTDASRAEFEAAINVLREGQERGEEPEAIATALKEASPVWKDLANLLLSQKAGVFYALLAFLFQLLEHFAEPPESRDVTIINQTIVVGPEGVREIPVRRAEQPSCTTAPDTVRQPSPLLPVQGKDRNRFCPCSSGVKWKKCCGAPQ